MRTIFSVLIWLYWTVCIITFFVLTSVIYLFTTLFDRFNTIPNRFLTHLGRLMLKINPGWKIKITGAEESKVSKPTIVVANHQSFLDLPLLYFLPWSMKWVAKQELFHIPILGWIIYMTGHISINREAFTSVKKLDLLVKPIQEGIPAMIFPEGTRTNDGELKRFKSGAFKLAKRYGFNILPVVIKGSYEAMPGGEWRIYPKQLFNLKVLEPVDAQQWEAENELKQHVYTLIEQELTD